MCELYNLTGVCELCKVESSICKKRGLMKKREKEGRKMDERENDKRGRKGGWLMGSYSPNQ